MGWSPLGFLCRATNPFEAKRGAEGSRLFRIRAAPDGGAGQLGMCLSAGGGAVISTIVGGCIASEFLEGVDSPQRGPKAVPR
jgi:hypothetical protein